MKKIFSGILYSTIVFAAFCALSYQDDTDVDGSLSFGFPFEIYHKAVRVMFVDTQTIGESTNFYFGNLMLDMSISFIVVILLIPIIHRLKRRKENNLPPPQ